MELSLCCWPNNKKIGPILAIKSKDFNHQYVAENLIKDIPIKNKKINVKGLAINSKKLKKVTFFLL